MLEGILKINLIKGKKNLSLSKYDFSKLDDSGNCTWLIVFDLKGNVG